MALDIGYESDRGCIIVAAALMDQLLESVIREHVKVFSISKSLEKSLFDLSGPISNFSAKISISRAFGLIDELAYGDLMTLRKLRNSFAHEMEEASFTSELTRQKVRGMHFFKIAMKKTSIKRYNFVAESQSKTDKAPRKILKEWEALADGYILYDKAIFCFAIQHLELHVLQLAKNAIKREAATLAAIFPKDK